VRAALRKLVRALPESFRMAAERAATAVVVDPAGWGDAGRDRPNPPHLDAVQRAVVEGEQLRLGYIARTRESTSRVVHPLGLAAKGASWYLVADTDAGLRTFRVDRITSVEPTGEPVVRPEGFDLTEAWRLITEQVDERRMPVRVRALVAPDTVHLIRWVLQGRVRIGPPAPDGRVEVEVRGASMRALAGELAGFGAGVEVVEPAEVRAHLAQVGVELARTYGKG
jgi:predicted DNA-binding transcriptional regulator YafY